MVIIEDYLKHKVKEILHKKELERMNQYIFNGKVVEEVLQCMEQEDVFEEDKNEENMQEDMCLSDYKKLFD